ncbi:MAG: NADH-quinone oxidoreductase subunit J [Candidatus Gastranaerophilales bacterium]|nr:NADH-quinone oxidoreductase subunit J [Candidatus Gastranaerophilales bacterium]
MDVVYSLFFLILSFTVILSALGVVFLKKIVHSMVSLIICFLSIAGIYIMLNADFVAISQLMIYAVGITIIMIFAIMLTSRESEKKLWIALAPRTLFALLTSAGLFALIAYSVWGDIKNIKDIFNINPPGIEMIEFIKQSGTSVIIGKQLFTNYLLPFELLSVLLLAAILGAVVLTKKDSDKLVNPITEVSKEEG